MITPTTTGTTSTSAAVATLRWGRKGSMTAARPTEAATPTIAPMTPRRTVPLSYGTGPAVTSDGTVENLLRGIGGCSDRVKNRRRKLAPMADFLVALGIIGFTVAMLGLIWALDRV